MKISFPTSLQRSHLQRVFQKNGFFPTTQHTVTTVTTTPVLCLTRSSSSTASLLSTLLFATCQFLHGADLGFQLLATKMALQPVDALELFSVASNCYGIAVTPFFKKRGGLTLFNNA